MGELAQLSGRPSLVEADALSAVEAVVIPPERLRALLIAEAELGERIMRALILRRVGLIETGGGGPIIVGREAMATCCGSVNFLRRNGHPYQRLDPETDPLRADAGRAVPGRARGAADRALPGRPAAAQSDRERARALHRPGRADRSRTGCSTWS